MPYYILAGSRKKYYRLAVSVEYMASSTRSFCENVLTVVVWNIIQDSNSRGSMGDVIF